MARKQTLIGIDADQIVGRDKAYKTEAISKTPWMAAKMTIHLPKTLMEDLKEEANKRKLSHSAILRDLAVAWVIANKEGIKSDDYRAKLQQELRMMEKRAQEAKEAQKAKLAPGEVKKKAQEAVIPKPVIPERDQALHRENPFSGGLDDSDGWSIG